MENDSIREDNIYLRYGIEKTLETLKKTKCQLLKTGNKLVKQIFYFCSCDIDQKEPKCKDCIENCHRGHYIVNSYEIEAICHCGLKFHEMNKYENEKIEGSEKCIFTELARISKIPLIYKDSYHNCHLCAFCLNFCYKDDKEIEETIIIHYKETSEKLLNNSYESNQSKSNQNISCECTHDNHKSQNKIMKIFFEMFYYKNDLNADGEKIFSLHEESINFKEDSKNSNPNTYLYSYNILNINSNENNMIKNKIISNFQLNDYNDMVEKKISQKLVITNKNDINFFTREKIKYLKLINKKIIKFEYFGSLNINQLINLILQSKRTYTNYFGFFEKYLIYIKNEINSENFDIDSQIGFSTFLLCLGALRNMAESIKYINYSNYNLEEHLTEEFIFKSLIDKKFDYKNTRVWEVKNNLFYLYFKFIFKKDFSKFPNLPTNEISNLHPLQHLVLISNVYTNNNNYISKKYLKNQNFLNLCIKKLKKVSEIKENNIHKYEILRTFLRILYYISKWNAFKQENIINYCNITDELIFKLFQHNKENGIFIPEKDKYKNFNKINIIICQIKILIKIIKTQIHFILNYNNDLIYKMIINNDSLCAENLEKVNFFISDPEIGRSINKNIINIMNFSRNLKKYNLKEVGKLQNYINRIQTLSFECSDSQVINIRRILDKNREIYLNLIETDVENGIIGTLGTEEIDFLKLILNEGEKLESLYQRYNKFENSYEEFLAFFHEKLRDFLSRYGLFNSEIPEVDFNFENLELEKVEKRKSKDVNYFVEKKGDKEKGKIYEMPLRLLGDFENLINKTENSINQDKNNISLKLLLIFKILINKSFYINTIIKGLKIIVLTELNKKRDLDVIVNPNIFVAILRLLYFYVEENIDNCFTILNSNFFALIDYLDLPQVDLLLNYLTFILVNLMNNSKQFTSSKIIIKICKIILNKILRYQNNLNLMLKYINVLKLVNDFSYTDQTYFYERIRKILKEFYHENNILSQFKSNLLQLTKTNLIELSNRKTRDVNMSNEQKSIIDSVIIKENYFIGGNLENIQISNPNKNKMIGNDVNFLSNENKEEFDFSEASDFQQTLIIYTLYLKLVNFIFDGNANLDEEKFLCSILNQEEIQQILGKKDLNLKLRLEILKFFKMIYINVIIDKSKIKIYRSVIINQITKENNDEILEEKIRYDFFNNLIGISSKDLNLTFEYNILKFELKHIVEIMNSFQGRRKKDHTIIDYFEKGILIPLYLFLNKFMITILDLKGNEYLNLYEIVIYFLRMKIYLVENYLESFKEENKKGEFFKNVSIQKNYQISLFKKVNREITLDKIYLDLEKLKKKDFEIFNYKLVYSIFQKHFDEFIVSFTSKSILDLFNKKEVLYTERKIEKIRKRFKKLGMLDNNFELNVFNLIFKYENDKNKFQSSAFLSCLDEHNLEYNSNFRYLLIRSLFYSINDKNFGQLYRNKNLNILLKLLQFQTVPIQKEIFLIYDYSEESINMNFIINLFFENLLCIIFSSCNPSSVKINENYLTSLLIIKIFKYLCEEHYKNFQKIFFTKLKFDYFTKAELDELNIAKNIFDKSKIKSEKNIKTNFDNQNISEENILNGTEDLIKNSNNEVTFFELMLCILGKIIIISKWNTIELPNSSVEYDIKHSDYFSDIFFSIIELLIEMIQGTDAENLENIVLDTRGKNNYFYTFLKIAKNIIYHENHNSRIVNNSRKNIIEFIIAFLEEKSTPKKLVQLIASVINPYRIFEAITKIMKKIFVMIHPNYKNKEEIYIHFYNLLLFNKEIKNYFIDSYFNNPNFCSRDEFELANRMYQYVKLLAFKFENEEAIDLINLLKNEEKMEKKIKIKIENKNKIKKTNYSNEDDPGKSIINNNFIKRNNNLIRNTTLNINNNRNNNNIHTYQNLSSIPNLSNNDKNNHSNKYIDPTYDLITQFFHNDKFFQMCDLDRSNDTFNYEIVNVIRFFEMITRKIIVQNGEDQVMVLFTLSPSIPYLSNNTKIDFYENINRESRFTKLHSLMEYCDYFQMEINYNYKRSKIDELFVFFNKFNFKFLEFLLFLLLTIINLIMLFANTNNHLIDGNQKFSSLVFGLGIMHVSLNSILIIIWFYTKYNLYYQIEKKKFLLKHKVYYVVDLSKYRRFFVIPIIETILKKGEINGFIWNVIFSSLAISNNNNHFFFAIETFIVINLSKTLKNLINAVLLKYKQLLACVFSLTIIVFFFSSISFFFLSGDYMETIQTVKNFLFYKKFLLSFCKNIIYFLIIK